MSFELTIEFNNSTSSNLPYAIRIARKFSYFYESKDKSTPNKIVLSQTEYVQKQKLFTDLWNIVGNWKGSNLCLDGKVIDNSSLFPIFRIINCSSEYEKAIIPEEHCFTINGKKGWGCRFLTFIGQFDSNASYYSYYSSQKYWFDFGEFVSINEWKIDKSKIIDILEREAEKNILGICPFFDIKTVRLIVDDLPEQIKVDEDSSWEIIYEENTVGTEIVKIAKGIKPRNKSKVIELSLKPQETDEVKEEKLINIPNVSFSDIGGIDEIIETVREIIELPIKRPDLFLTLGIKPHKGIILHGPPGCGKTLIAKAIANEINAHFILINGPELINKYYGESEENLRNIFDEAKNLQPTLIYFDEIDSIAQSRTDNENARLESRFVNQLLTLMDGVEDYGKVCVIGSTNRIELIDNALLRPGRFDFSIEIRKPSLEGCKKIFQIQTKNIPIEESFNKDEFSKKLFGLTGAEIAFVAREGAYNCLRRSIDLHKAINEQLLDEINPSSLIVVQDDFEKALCAALERNIGNQ